jgi:hypothetical protein
MRVALKARRLRCRFELPEARFDAEIDAWRHFGALFRRRFLMAKRDRKLWSWTVVYPFVVMILGERDQSSSCTTRGAALFLAVLYARPRSCRKA